MKNRTIYSNHINILSVILLIFLFNSCAKLYDLPEDKAYLSNNANYSISIVKSVIGRTKLFPSIFNPDNSNFPMTFQIKDVKNMDGSPSSALTKVKPVLVWKQAYTGQETTLDQINAKRTLENHPIFEVRSSGEFILWNSSKNEDLLKPAPDSLYTFNVQIANGGGQRTLGPFTFIPAKERPYEPSYNVDQVTGAPLKELNGQVKRILPITISNMRGLNTNRFLIANQASPFLQDVWVYFKRVGEGNSLTFKFMDKDSIAINPAKFNGTKWDNLIHGFNRQMTSTYVRYDVAYPIPVVNLATPYTTSDGSQAALLFAYNRIGFGGLREVGSMTLNFNIFQAGDWEIIFFFHNETPKFDNE